MINPVRLDRRGRRLNAHHNPVEPFRPEGKIRYNPKVSKRRPRAMPEERWSELFAGLRSNRDRAILALGISNAAHASELLGVLAHACGAGRLAHEPCGRQSDACRKGCWAGIRTVPISDSAINEDVVRHYQGKCCPGSTRSRKTCWAATHA